MAALTLATAAIGQNNPMAGKLITEGVSLPSGATIRLPEPSMADGLGAKAQQTVLKQVADKYPVEQFLRNSVVAPFVLKMESLTGATGERVGQRIDLWFVAHGTLQAVRDKKLLGELIAIDKAKSPILETKNETLDDRELAQRQIRVASTPDREETYSAFSAPILEKVQLSGVNRQMVTPSDGSIVAAQELAPQFANDARYPNQWRSIQRTPTGRIALGEPHAYSGNGQYVKVTSLVDAAGKPTGALLVEAHMVFDEPQGWFGGANLLRSKLPLAVQENVREFRRLLQQSSKKD